LPVVEVVWGEGGVAEDVESCALLKGVNDVHGSDYVMPARGEVGEAPVPFRGFSRYLGPWRRCFTICLFEVTRRENKIGDANKVEKVVFMSSSRRAG
jgi:hypothetical protein